MTCALPGCINRPACPSVSHGDSPLTCGSLHHQLLMAGRFNPALPPPFHAILSRNASGICALLSCKEPPRKDSSWCSRTHLLQWLTQFTSTLHPDQICMLPRCTRHVFVDDNGRASQFCGRRHQQKFVMLNSLPRRQQDLQSSVEAAVPQQPTLPASISMDESERDGMPSLNSRMQSLEKFAQSGNAPKNIRVIEDFYEKHPWEILKEGSSCWLIAGLKPSTRSKARKLTTKGHYHWKQSGRRAKNSGKYYTYTKRKGRELDADQQHAGSSMREYSMKEFTMEGVTSYSLIYLVKKRRSSYGKLGKSQHTERQVADDQVDNVSPQDTLTSEPSLRDDEDSIFGDLSCLDDSIGL